MGQNTRKFFAILVRLVVLSVISVLSKLVLLAVVIEDVDQFISYLIQIGGDDGGCTYSIVVLVSKLF